MPIRLRLTLWYTALLGGMLILFSSALYGIVQYSLYDEVERDLEQQAVDGVTQTEFYLRQLAISRDPTTIQSPPIDAFGSPDIFVELRYVTSRQVVQRSRNLEGRDLPLSATAYEYVRTGEPYADTVLFEGEPVRLLTRPVRAGNQVVGIIQVARSLADIRASLQRLLLYLMIGNGMTLLVAAVIGAWIAERALEPVDSVTQTALRISRAEDLSRRLPPYGARDEIGRLIEAFNEMLGRLDDVFRDQQRFVADVSHELRTPLTALQGNLELLKRGAFASEEARREALTTVESEVARLNRLVADLLLLARLDGGEELAHEPVELDTLLLDVFRQGQILVRAAGNGIRLRLGHEDQATVIGDPDRLRQLLLNLVDNAIKYTQQGEVVLSLWKDDARGEVQIAVRDTGIGIPRDALPFLFRRFYRADKARSRQLGGTGLGLAIVQWITEAHRGRIDVRSEEGVGSTFTVTLPLASADALAANRLTNGARAGTRVDAFAPRSSVEEGSPRRQPDPG